MNDKPIQYLKWQRLYLYMWLTKGLCDCVVELNNSQLGCDLDTTGEQPLC